MASGARAPKVEDSALSTARWRRTWPTGCPTCATPLPSRRRSSGCKRPPILLGDTAPPARRVPPAYPRSPPDHPGSVRWPPQLASGRSRNGRRFYFEPLRRSSCSATTSRCRATCHSRRCAPSCGRTARRTSSSTTAASASREPREAPGVVEAPSYDVVAASSVKRARARIGANSAFGAGTRADDEPTLG